jgi:methylmalonyl-CoA/ethylmalonyl-CoA epimerase
MAPATGPAITNLGQIGIRAHDVERATAFYRDVLGLKFLFAAPPKLAFFDCSGVRLMLSPAELPAFDHPSSVLYFRVPDIHAAYGVLMKGGAPIVSPPHKIAPMPDHDLWMAFFKDTEGNTLALMSEVPRK